mgnify:CR=1 FL=1
MRALYLLACLSPALAEDLVSPAVSVHVAAPLGTLVNDVNGHPGFGIGLHLQLGVGGRVAFRPQFEWTGYRVNDYNLGTRMLASLLDADYSEYRVVYRTYRIGVDLQVFQEDGYHGLYAVIGAGGLASAMYYEDRYVPSGDGPSQVQTLATSHRQTRGYGSVGIGYQWRSGGFMEARATTAPYHGAPGEPRNPGTFTPDRTAGALVFSAGVRF